VSLDAAVDALDDTSTLADRLADPEDVSLDIAVIDAIEHARLRNTLHAMSDEVRDILALHWELVGEPPWALGALQTGLNPAHP
jgi:DNA-directed RNA polymerase sigma subunit (sigma70/sigma32)